MWAGVRKNIASKRTLNETKDEKVDLNGSNNLRLNENTTTPELDKEFCRLPINQHILCVKNKLTQYTVEENILSLPDSTN